jgi:hypothetical protein
MKLSLLFESAKSDVIINALKSINVNILADSGNAIWVEPYPSQYGQLKFIIKRYGWQIHSLTKYRNRKGEDKLLGHITPLRGSKYKHTSDKLYHITDISNVDSILTNGLDLKSEALEMRFPKRIYLYPTLDMAVSRLKYARAVNFGGKKIDPALLEIDNSDHNIKLTVDPEAFMDVFASHYDDDVDIPVYTTKIIPPNRIRMIYPEN